MYYFLAIITKDDMLKGNFVPSFVLCNHRSEMNDRPQWFVADTHRTKKAVPPKILVTTLTGNNEMTDFMSNYIYYKPTKHGGTTAVSVKGGLFWVPCDIYGIQKGPALFIKKVPDKSVQKAYHSKAISMNELLTRDSSMYDLIYSHIKPKLFQKGRRGLNAGKKRTGSRREARNDGEQT